MKAIRHHSKLKIRKLRSQGLTIRQIMRKLNISSPSLVQFHLGGKSSRFLLPERSPVPGDKRSELLCAGFNEYRNIVLEIMNKHQPTK